MTLKKLRDVNSTTDKKLMTDAGKVHVLIAMLQLALKYGEMSEDGIKRQLPDTVCGILKKGIKVGLMLSVEDVDKLRKAAVKCAEKRK